MSNNIHVGDVGTVFKVRIVDDATRTALEIGDATTKELHFKLPDGTDMVRPALFTTDGTDGYIQYATVAGDLTLKGHWSVQGYVVTPTFVNSSDIGHFYVKGNI